MGYCEKMQAIAVYHNNDNIIGLSIEVQSRAMNKNK